MKQWLTGAVFVPIQNNQLMFLGENCTPVFAKLLPTGSLDSGAAGELHGQKYRGE